jgi:hypothetical protein
MSYKIFNYTEYEQIPQSTIQYIFSVADIENIAEVSLKDINEFLNMQENDDEYTRIT